MAASQQLLHRGHNIHSSHSTSLQLTMALRELEALEQKRGEADEKSKKIPCGSAGLPEAEQNPSDAA